MKTKNSQDYSDLEKMLYELEKEKNDDNIDLLIFAAGERLDHFLYIKKLQHKYLFKKIKSRFLR